VIVLAPLVGLGVHLALGTASRSVSRSAAAATAFAAIGSLAVVLGPFRVVVLCLGAAWGVLHLGLAIVADHHARRLQGSLFEARLKLLHAGALVLVAGPLAPALPTASAALVGFAVVIAVVASWGSLAGLSLAGSHRSDVTAAIRAIDAALRDPDQRPSALQPLLELVAQLLGATGGVTLVEDGRVLAATTDALPVHPTSEVPHRRVTRLGPGDHEVRVDTGRGDLVLRLAITSHLVGRAEIDLLEATAERIGLALDRAEARRLAHDATVERLAAERMRDDFLATISHELRTPLTSIRGFSEVMFAHGGDIDTVQYRDLLGRIRDNAVDLERTLAALLDLAAARSRNRPERTAEYDLADLVDRVVAGTNGELLLHTVDVDVEHVTVCTDGLSLATVLRHLLDNVAKFTPPGTRVCVRGRPLPAARAVELVVLDDGPGVPEDLRERVFDPFSRGGEVLTRETRGVGIGLTIARELVRQLGGTMTLDPSLRGTAVRLVLPAHLSQETPARTPAATF